MSRTPRRLFAATTALATALVALPLTALSASAAEPHVDNPYAGATQYVNPSWAALVEGAATRASDPALATKMRAVKTQPTAVWMDRISAIAGNTAGNGLRFHLDQALLQKQSGTPLVMNLVIYDLPGRDCYALASNGELPATAAGLARYKTEYIDAIAAILADPKYQSLRIAATIEPDSLPNLVTNISHQPCQQAAPFYREGVKYALDKLHAIPNVYNYLDAAHSGWLGWDSNAGPSAKLFAEVARTTQAGYASVDGFVTNTANTTPLVEPYLPNPSLTVGGNPVRSAKYYEWNFDFDEADWTAHLYNLLIAEGFPASTGLLVDTSRNGWGGAARPTAASTSTDLHTYVDQSRVDRRIHRGAWCNPSGAGIGERPQSTPGGYAGSHLDAFVWIKPPGESDGASTDIPNDEGKGFDRMCDPTFVSPKLGNQLTGALPDAPLSGHWFEAQFVQLVQNAYPVIGGGPSPTDPTPPSAPTGLTAGSVSNTSVALTWTASTDNVGVTGYDIYRGSTLAGSSATTSFSATGLTANTTYSFTVRAKDAAGNVSAPSAALSVTTTGSTTPPGGCKVGYSVNSWNTGFTASLKLTNTSTTPLTNWALSFDFANGQTVQSGWNANWTQSGTKVTGTPVPGSWNATIAPGATVDIGFNGTHSGTNNPPTTFTVNGQTCALA
ncbi:glycoside hydrolase family 6 protein [Kribbella sp. NPDC056951]|uniref:glycoside hydrolase family 6 protein n=1 Tax=Kribbella sp. NPDC056951 TaxID=3345978 RepID=UPI00363DD8E4